MTASDLTHVMTDLETLGTVPGCVAFSIGCVEFDPHAGKLGREFYEIVNVDSSLDHYLREDDPNDPKGATAWWAKQADEAKVALTAARAGEGLDLPVAMAKLNQWFQSLALKSKIRLYGNGADFDNPILRVMYDAAKVQPYPGGYGGRCYRSLKNLDELLGPEFKFHKLERQGTYHNALDDAKSQAMHLMENIARIRRSIITGGEE